MERLGAFGVDPLPCPSGLFDGERLILAGLRAWGRCRCDGEPAEEHVRSALAEVSSERAAALFAALMQWLEQNGRRPVQIHCGAGRGYSPDEQRLVLACGVAAAAPKVARRLLEPLARQPEALMVLARALGGALAADGLALPVRLARSPGFERPPATLH
jgi:hypothetical protein